MVVDNKALSVTVIAVGLFLELQVYIEQEEEEEAEDGGHAADDPLRRWGSANYYIIPYTKQDKSTLTIDHLKSILSFGSFELDRLLSDGRYEVMARDVAVSQVLVSPAALVVSVDGQTTLPSVTARFVGCPLREQLCVEKYEPSMEREQFVKLSRALGEDIIDITGALLVIHRIVTGDGGLKELKERLMKVSNNLPHQGKGQGRNLYLDCIYLLHGLCNVRISVPPTSYRDYLQRLLGFVLNFAGISISMSNSTALGMCQLTTTKGNICPHHSQSNQNFAAKAMLKCTIYGPDVDVGEIARSMMPMFVEDNLEPESLLR